MKITLHSPVEGKQPGESADVPEDRARWLIENGYAVEKAGDPPPAKKPKKAKEEEPPAE